MRTLLLACAASRRSMDEIEIETTLTILKTYLS